VPLAPAWSRPATVAFTLALAVGAAGCARGPRVVAPPPTPITAAELKQKAADPASKVVLVNVWATWCEPCREELPALVRLRRELAADGVQVILVSADFDKTTEELVAFLEKNGIDFPTYLKTEKDSAFIEAMDADWSGAIPVSFLYVDGQSVDFWEGAATYEAFNRKVREALGPAPTAG
jgi:thiol-disulfide isomerase/thioredoxin